MPNKKTHEILRGAVNYAFSTFAFSRSSLMGFPFLLFLSSFLFIVNTGAGATGLTCTYKVYNAATANGLASYPDADSAYAACITFRTGGRCPQTPAGTCNYKSYWNGREAYTYRHKFRRDWYALEQFFYDGPRVCQGGLVLEVATNNCILPPPPIEEDNKKQKGKPDCNTTVEKGNPCDPSSGNKYESATDYRGSALSFTRSYNSLEPNDGSLGFGWSGNRYKQLEITSSTAITVHHADGKGEAFVKTGSSWVGDADTDRILVETGSGYAIELSDGSTEQYGANGKLTSETNRNGHVTSYTYNGVGKLSTLTGPYGHTLQFSYDTAGHLSSLIDPSGEVITYTYDTENNLSTVLYPDGGQRIYHYENAAFPHHLTGITDESGNRYSTFAYDSEGRAIFTGHAQTDNGDYQEGFTLEYNEGGQ